MKRGAERQAALLVRLYPRQWRGQFPDFEGVLVEELAVAGRGIQWDVLRGAMVERLRDFGIIPKRPADGGRSGLALIYAALVPFAGLALGMWSQLHTGLGSHPAMSVPALRASNHWLTIGAIALLIAVPLAVALLAVDGRRWGPRGNRTSRAEWRPLICPSMVFLGSLGLLSGAGLAADRSGWYAPAAAALPRHGAGHLATLWARGIIAGVTPAWIHPTMLAGRPAGELAAVLIAPIATLVAAGAFFRLIVSLPTRTPSWANVVLATTAFGMMVVSVAACGRWVVDHPGREGATTLQAHGDQLAPGHTGWIVLVLLGALAVTAVVGLHRVLSEHLAGPAGIERPRARPAASADSATSAGVNLRLSTR